MSGRVRVRSCIGLPAEIRDPDTISYDTCWITGQMKVALGDANAFVFEQNARELGSEFMQQCRYVDALLRLRNRRL